MGIKPRWNKRSLLPLFLSHLRLHEDAGSQPARSRRRHRPARIAEWLTRVLRGLPLHHISSYSIQSLRGFFLKSGSLREAGREAAKFTPPFGRDFGGHRCPAQSHQKQEENKTIPYSNLAEDTASLNSAPKWPSKGKTRRGFRSEAASLNRRERRREKRARQRREYREIKSRWKGLIWEAPRPDLHLGTLGSQASLEASTPAIRVTSGKPIPLPPPVEPPHQWELRTKICFFKHLRCECSFERLLFF